MSQSELLRFVKRLLESLGIDFMLTGSMVSSAQGEPRMTHDIDIMVRLEAKTARQLVEAFDAAGFYVSDAAAQDAVRRSAMFNVLQTSTGQKIDFYVLPNDEYEQTRFARRIMLDVAGEHVPATSVEDTILSKLRWAKLSGHSERQLGDAARVYELHAAQLDRPYLEHWITRLELQELWQRLISTTTPLDPA